MTPASLSLQTWRLLPRLAVLAAVLLWAGTFPATRVALQELGPSTLAALRFLLAGPALLLLGSGRRPASAQGGWAAPALGLLFFGLGMGLANLGAARTTAAHASLMTGAIPLCTAACAALLLAEPIGRRLVAALLVGGLGMALVAGDLSAGDAAGDLLVAGSAVIAALFIVWQKQLVGRGWPEARLLGTAMLWGGAAHLPLAFREVLGGSLPSSSAGVAALAYLVLLGSVAAFWLYAWGSSRLPAGEAGLYINLEAAAGAVLSATLLGEVLPVGTLLGGALILASTLAFSLPEASPLGIGRPLGPAARSRRV